MRPLQAHLSVYAWQIHRQWYRYQGERRHRLHNRTHPLHSTNHNRTRLPVNTYIKHIIIICYLHTKYNKQIYKYICN